jgi:hypothetical protein
VDAKDLSADGPKENAAGDAVVDELVNAGPDPKEKGAVGSCDEPAGAPNEKLGVEAGSAKLKAAGLVAISVGLD